MPEVKQIFKKKIKICEGEASETQYWLEIIEELNWANTEKIKVECNELLALFTSINRKSI